VARAGTRAVARDESGHTPSAYSVADLQGGICFATVASERDDHLFNGTARANWINLIRLLSEDFEILVIDRADNIDKHSAFAVRFVDRDSGRQSLSRQSNNRDRNESHFCGLAQNSASYRRGGSTAEKKLVLPAHRKKC
jgi:hypothetical protein